MTPFDALANLLIYPDQLMEPRARACVQTLRVGSEGLAPNHAAADAVQRFADIIGGRSLAELQEEYTSVFDLGAACALELGWHLFGETCDRGGFLAVLREDLQRAGIEERAGLPDHMSHVLALVARETPERAAALAELVAPAIVSVHGALATRDTPYVHLLEAADALLGPLSGRNAPEGTA